MEKYDWFDCVFNGLFKWLNQVEWTQKINKITLL